MIRISIEHQSRQRTVLKVEGDLAGSAVCTMGREGELGLTQSEELVLDFGRVLHIDDAGAELLRSWSNRLRVHSCPPFIRLLLAQYGIAVERGGDEQIKN